MGGILILQGSPRPDGNTVRLARALADGAGGQAEIFSVCAHDIRPCLGCNACAAAPGHACVQRDDMPLLYDKLRRMQTLVIASPVYFYGVSAQLKAAVDRLHTPLRDAFPLRRTALLLVGAAHRPDLFDAVLAQYRLILSYFGLEDAGRVLAPGCRDAGAVEGSDALRQAFELGRRLAETEES